MSYTNGLDKPSDYFSTKLYTGNATNPTTISGIGFQPDLVWTKGRSTAEGHRWCDSVRGATKDLLSNTSSAESTNTIGLKSFNSDGYVIGNSNGYNQNSQTFVSWNWKAGTSVSGNTTGSGTSKSYTGSVNTTAGFSIIRYTGNGTAGHTIPHHLGVQPQLVICKRLGQAGQWVVGSMALPNQFEQFLELDLTGAAQTSSLRWNNTDPSSSVFTVGTTADTNQDGTTIIAYSFAQKQGYSKFGNYTGNGSTDGPFVYTGFRPAFVLQKKSSAVQGWQLQDNKREGYNGDNDLLQPHDSAAESGVNRIDILSNGFKVITTDAGQNSSGGTYIYMAFAESPLVTSTGIPTTAR